LKLLGGLTGDVEHIRRRRTQFKRSQTMIVDVVAKGVQYVERQARLASALDEQPGRCWQRLDRSTYGKSSCRGHLFGA
jgi:hypothetical protein